MSKIHNKYIEEQLNDIDIIQFLDELSQAVIKNSTYIKEIIKSIKELTDNQKDFVDVLYKIEDEFTSVNNNIVNITKSNLFLNKIMDLMTDKIRKISKGRLLN